MNLNKTTKGIYTITNLVDGKYYIGSSITIEERLKKHKRTLLNNKHHCKYLQRAWNKYGEDKFKFDIVLNLNHCTEKIIRAVEQEILDKEFNSTYNSCKIARMTSEQVKHTIHSKNKRKSGADVLFHIKSKKWRATINIQNDSIYLGCFDTYEEALKARLDAENKYWAADYIYTKRPICVPLNYRRKFNKFEVNLKDRNKNIKYNKTFNTEEEAYQYVKDIRERLGIIY